MLTEPARQPVTLRPLRRDDIDAAMNLVVMAGWNQTAEDWRVMLSVGEGYGVDDDRGRLLATSIVLHYATVGWIGMVLVDETARRRGIATQLLKNAISVVERRGLVPMLDATPAGRDVYRRLGFTDVAGITRWRGAGAVRRDAPRSATTQIAGAASASGLIEAAKDFGGVRKAVLSNIASRSGAVTLALSGRHAWLWSRAGRTATQVGPIITENEHDAVELLSAALNTIEGPVLIDVPDRETTLQALLLRGGFSKERVLTRMAAPRSPSNVLGPNLRAIAGPELG